MSNYLRSLFDDRISEEEIAQANELARRQHQLQTSKVTSQGTFGEGVQPFGTFQNERVNPGMNKLQGAAMVSSSVPLLSDALGIAGDIQMYQDYPETRGAGNYALTALGAVPFVPAVAGVSRAVRKPTISPLSEAVEQSVRPGSPTRGPQSAPFQRTPLTPAERQAGTGAMAHADSSFEMSGDLAAKLSAEGIDTRGFVELQNTPQARQYFQSQGLSAQGSMGDVGAQVDIYDSPSSYTGTRLFMDEKGKVGFGVKPDGDIVSVFADKAETGGKIGSVATALATQEGGRKLDAFNKFLPEKVYGPMGYRSETTVPFDREYAPDGWPASQGEPGVDAMRYDPNAAPITPQQIADYDQALSLRDRAGVYAPDMTPGTVRQLHEASTRPQKQGTRSTVKSPQQKAKPGVYQGTQELIDQVTVAPENPLMESLFGVNRQDLDDMTRAAQFRDQRIGPEELPVTGTNMGYMRNIKTPANEQRLQDVLATAATDPKFVGSYGWYMQDPLAQKYMQELGPIRGLAKFREMTKAGSALSPNTPVPLEARRTSLYNYDPEKFVNTDLSSGEKVMAAYPELFGEDLDYAKKYAGMYHQSQHVPALKRMQEMGDPFNPDRAQSPKTPNYYYSRTGENYRYGTGDAHFVRGIGLADTRPNKQSGAPAETGSIKAGETGFVRDWWDEDVTAPLGMTGSPGQALMWNVLAPQTGVRTDVGKPLLELQTDLIQERAKRTGNTPEQTLQDWILGNDIIGKNRQQGLMDSWA